MTVSRALAQREKNMMWGWGEVPESSWEGVTLCISCAVKKAGTWQALLSLPDLQSEHQH